MQQYQTPKQKQINSKEINDCIKELGVVKVDIHKRIPKISTGIKDDSDYVHIKKPLKEEYSDKATSTVASHVLNGGDYHEELNSLHKNVEPFVDPETTHNAHDNYIHEVLSRGKPSGETVAHVLDVIHARDKSQENSQYLALKWHPFINAHARVSPEIKTLDNAAYTKDELARIPKTMTPKGLRLLNHETSNHLFEMHPQKGLQYVGPSTAVRYDSRGDFTTNHLDAHNTLSKEYEDYHSDDVYRYTVDSSPINAYHHRTHAGEDVSRIHQMTKEQIEEMSGKVSDYIKNVPHPTHIGDFHVYTGLYAESNPLKDAKHTDEQGNLILHNPSFTSTSVHAPVSFEFARMKHDANEHTASIGDVFKIRIPGGYPHGAYVQPHSEHDHEFEYLLDKGHTFKVSPIPKYIATGNSVHRVWDVELHHAQHDNSVNFDDLHRADKVSMLLRKEVAPDLLSKGANDDQTMVRAAAAKHPNLSAEHFEILSKDESPKVRMSLGRNPNVPDHVVKQNIGDLAFAAGYAQNPKISLEHVDSLINHDYSSVGAEFAKRHDLTDDHIAKIINLADPRHLASLASNTSLHPDLLHAFTSSDNKNILKALAGNSSIHRKTLEFLKGKDDNEVYPIAAKNPANHRLR